MKKLFSLTLLAVFALLLGACGGQSAASETKTRPAAKNESAASIPKEAREMSIKITVNGKTLLAKLEDNATARALAAKMPMTLPMLDLYGREMCYRYGAYALPTGKLRSDNYAVGDIAYWPPGGSLVILYKQNGEQFERQHLGHIASGVEVFDHIGDTNVKFELVKK